MGPPEWGTGLRPDSVTASSYYVRGREVHPAEHAFDANVGTAWNDGVDGNGHGEWLEARFAIPRHITGFRLTTGFLRVARHGRLDLFYANARIHTLRVTADGQQLGLYSSTNDQREIFVSGLDVRASAIRFEVLDTFPGSHFQDVCISEIAFLGGP